MQTSLEVEAANAQLLAPTATDLACLFENGDDDVATSRIQALGRDDFIAVLRVVRQLDSALSNYALSWQGAECWGNGAPYPDEPETEAKAA